MSKIVTCRSGVVIQVVIGPDHHRLSKLPHSEFINEFGVKRMYLKPAKPKHPYTSVRQNEFEIHVPNEHPVAVGWTVDTTGTFHPPISNNPTQRTA
jgi:hypothetical protein